jgi:hypothetical protein
MYFAWNLSKLVHGLMKVVIKFIINMMFASKFNSGLQSAKAARVRAYSSCIAS